MKRRGKIVILSIAALLAVSCVITPIAIKVNANNASGENRQYQYWLSFDTNGGNNVKDVLYVNGDKIKLPEPVKYGFCFAGWYLDNDTFEKPFYPGSSEVKKNTTLFAKWVIKAVKIYFDTANENEFEPLVLNVGETFHISSLPSVVLDKIENGVAFGFDKWLTGNEKEVLEDFIVKDQYYEFHAKYGFPNIGNYELKYQSNFDTNYGYIDSNHSWSRGEMLLPATGVGQSDPIQDVHVDNGNLVIGQMRHKNEGYGAKAILPHEFTAGLKTYSLSAEFRINDYLIPNSPGKNDVGFGLMVGFNPTTGANVEAVFDAYTKTVRLSACNKSYAKSGTDVNALFSYALPTGFDMDAYHTLKVKYNGITPSTSTNLNATNIYVYLDDVECFNTKDVILNKNWFYSDQASGDYCGLSASVVEASVKEVNLKSYDETSTIYRCDFASHNYDTFADGWKYLLNQKGANVGETYIRDGRLTIDTYFKNQTLLKNQTIYTPADKIKNFLLNFKFKFEDLFATDKYFAIAFRGDLDNTFNAFIVRGGTGAIQLYKHGVNNNYFSDWGSSDGIKTITDGFGLEEHEMTVLVKDEMVVFYLDGQLSFTGFKNQSSFYNRSGYVGFLTSSAKVSFDDVAIYDLDKEVK